MDPDSPEVVVCRSPGDRRCAPDVQYVKSKHGILKILQAVISIVTFALSMSAEWATFGGGWVNFVSINAFIQAVIWFCLHIFSVIPPILANYFIELIIYAVFTLFYFIAGIVAACKAFNSGAVGAASFFCFLCMVLFGIDAVFQFLDVRKRYKARNDRRSVPDSANAANTTEDTLFVRPGSDKGFY